jgi:DNA-binding transcriptional ArsR family regulator
MRHPEHIKAEHERVRILEFMSGRKLSNQEIREALNITKSKLSHHLKVLLVGKYIVKEHHGGNIYLYKRTRQTYTPKTIEVLESKEDKSETLIEDTIYIKPTSPYARVVRLLQNPLPSAPKSKKSSSMYGGIQSGMGRFDGY